MDEPERLRIDKWLWAARFMKTRSLAADAVKGGRVQVGGQRVKPSREIASGDHVQITVGHTRRTVVVLGVAARRGPAAEARLLYEETAESRAEGERQAAEPPSMRTRRLAGPPQTDPGGRPTKRDRRRFEATPNARRGRR